MYTCVFLDNMHSSGIEINAFTIVFWHNYWRYYYVYCVSVDQMKFAGGTWMSVKR